jgi:hypothetical protein
LNFEEVVQKVNSQGGFRFTPYSPSRLETGDLCPGHFQAAYLLQMKKTSMNQSALDKGSATHYVLERIIQRRFDNAPLSMADVALWLDEAKILFPHISGDLLTNVEEMCNSMVQRSLEIPLYQQANIKEVEKKIAIDFDGGACDYDDPFCFARGKIDVYLEVGHEAYVIDHKTQKNWERPDTMKMLFYAWLVFRSKPHINSVGLMMNFTDPVLDRFSNMVTVKRSQVIQPKEGEPGFSYDPEDQFSSAEERIMSRIYNLEKLSQVDQMWPQIINSKCHYCPAFFVCDTRKEASTVMAKGGYPEVNTREQAEAALRTILVYEDLIDYLKKQLKVHIEREDVPDRMVRVGDQAYMKKPETHVKFNDADQDKLFEYIKKIGADPKLYLEWSGTKLKKLFATIDDIRLETELRAIVPEKTVIKHVIAKVAF